MKHFSLIDKSLNEFLTVCDVKTIVRHVDSNAGRLGESSKVSWMLLAITNIPQTSTWGQIMKMHEGIFEVTPTFWCQKFLP